MKGFRNSESAKAFVMPGKHALKGEHRAAIVESRRSRVLASLDFEALSASDRRHLKRWDYFIEVDTKPGKAHAVEVHAFEPKALIGKQRGTIELLKSLCPAAIEDIQSWQVVLTGSMPRQDLAARLRAETKISIAGRSLDTSKL